ncbi:MAG: GNAT family N-acetyltransferase [Conexivisphaerales archaeon]
MSVNQISLNELNEYEWWSYWGNHLKNDYFYAIKSDFFREPLFNRVGFLSGNAELPSDLINSDMSFFVPIAKGYWDVEKLLLTAGYIAVDRLDIYNFKKPIIKDENGVEIIKGKDIDKWISTYVRSFEEDINLIPYIRDSLKRALADGKTTLIAKMDGNVFSGVAAVYEGEISVGVYCVGVLPEYRHRKIGTSLVNFASTFTDKPIFLQAFSSAALGKFYKKSGFELIYSKEVLKKSISNKCGSCFTNFYVKRDARPGIYNLNQIFVGLDGCISANLNFSTNELESTKVIIENTRGYMHVLDGKVRVNLQYLQVADIRFLYLDILHELIHISQSIKGENLYDTRFTYFNRPTEIEAYRFAISEAQKIGMNTAEIKEYLKVEWVSEGEFNDFLKLMNLN